jgi:ferritin-like metal-binding protein YciE
MDASPDVLAQSVRAKRVAIDNDLELLRVRLQKADPRRLDVGRWAPVVLPIVGAVAAIWLWTKRRRPMRSLGQLMVFGLSDLHHVEQQLVPALRRMSQAASNPELKRALEQHCYETDVHVERLARVFRSVGARPRRGRSEAITAMIAEGERLVNGKVDPDVRDAWLIASAQRIEHFEIATYGTVRTYAETLGYTYAAQLLQQTLDEERAADEKLTTLAERFVNPQSVRRMRPRSKDRLSTSAPV